MFDTPGYIFDPALGELSLVDTIIRPGFECGDPGAGCAVLIGDYQTFGQRQLPIYSEEGTFWGNFALQFFGDWFVNGQQVAVPDEPIAVSEPGVLGLFGLGLAGLVFGSRRRRKRATNA